MNTTTHYPDVRTVMKRYGLSTKASWGQCFLIAESVFAALVNATVLDSSDKVIEIGAGAGSLTMRLADHTQSLLAIERDREWIPVLNDLFNDQSHVEIIEGNALTFDYNAEAQKHGSPLIICGNLPYQIAGPILMLLFSQRQAWKRLVVMVQHEMAHRLVAHPSTKAYGALSVLTQTYAKTSMVMSRISPGAFVPQPKVDSSIVMFEPLHDCAISSIQEDHFRNVVMASFAQRRKTLRNSLQSAFDRHAIDHALDRSSIDGSRRGETLSIEEFVSLSQALRR